MTTTKQRALRVRRSRRKVERGGRRGRRGTVGGGTRRKGGGSIHLTDRSLFFNEKKDAQNDAQAPNIIFLRGVLYKSQNGAGQSTDFVFSNTTSIPGAYTIRYLRSRDQSSWWSSLLTDQQKAVMFSHQQLRIETLKRVVQAGNGNPVYTSKPFYNSDINKKKFNGIAVQGVNILKKWLAVVERSSGVQTTTSQQQMQVTVPQGVVAGQTFTAQTPDGQNISVTVPTGVNPGQVLTVSYPPAPAQTGTPAPAQTGPQVPAQTGTPAQNTPTTFRLKCIKSAHDQATVEETDQYDNLDTVIRKSKPIFTEQITSEKLSADTTFYYLDIPSFLQYYNILDNRISLNKTDFLQGAQAGDFIEMQLIDNSPNAVKISYEVPIVQTNTQF